MSKNKVKEKYLPIGTVVLLKGGRKYAMITSYFIFPTGKDPKKELFDYGGCEYPEGVIDSKTGIGFNHENIEKVIHLGFEDEDFEYLNNAMKQNGEILKKEFIKALEATKNKVE